MSTVLIVLFIVILATLVLAGYVWWKRRLYTRERFAFASLSLFGGLTCFVVGSFLSQMTPWDALQNLIAQLAGVSYTPPLWRTTDAILSFLLVVFCGSVALKFHKNWDGKKSVEQHQREQARQPMTFLVLVTESALQVRQWLHPTEPILEEYPGEEASPHSTLQGSKADLVWHKQARELWQQHRRSYVFDVYKDWHEDHRCWIGKHKKTGETIVLACWQEMPGDKPLKSLLDYVARVQPSTQSVTKPEIIIALKQGEYDKEKQFQKHHILYVSEAVLLDKLVDFSDYFQDIRYQVEQKQLPDSELTIQQTYTPSSYQLQKDNKNPQAEDVESFINQWLIEPGLRQLALLGEYGQGKTTASLMLSYHLSQRWESGEKVRVPILLELRGKSPRTLAPQELLSIWAGRYGIDPNALMQLLIAGRLLLIFEGFDEVDLTGDSESRLNHFRTLWKLAYPDAKILITGRPNFFLDDAELKAALGIQERRLEHPYCQAVYLARFSEAQIADSLRAVEKSTRDEMVALAKQDNKFYEIVARPSLLYIVSTLWQRENLSSVVSEKRINSAMVMDLFIQHSYRRQGAKAEQRKQDNFMALNSAERAYFMEGIAVYMAVNDLPNHISTLQLDDVVRTLIKAIPDTVSKSVAVVENETRKPLRQRFDWQHKEKDAIEHIKTDVRACGLLVTDLTKENTFKFGHKSFMEFLTAKVFAQWLVKRDLPEDKKVVAASLVNTLKLRRQQVFRQAESRYFMVEWLSVHIQKQKSVDELQMAKDLFNAIFETDTLRQKVLAFSSKAILSLTGWLVQYFGEKQTERLMSPLFVAVGTVVTVVVTAVAYVGPVAGVAVAGVAGVAGVAVAVAVAVAGFAVAGVAVAGAGFAVAVAGVAVAGAGVAVAGAFAGVAGVAVAGVAGVAGVAFAFAGAFAGLFAIILVKLGFTFSFVLLITMLIFVPGLILGFIVGLSQRLLLEKRRKNPDSIWTNFELWYYACSRILKLDRNSIVKFIGKKAMVLFEESESSSTADKQ